MYFTNQGTNQSDNNSSLFAYSSFTKAEGQKLQSQYDFQAKFDLPNTTKNLKIVIEKQQDDIANVLSDNAVSNNKTITQDGRTFTKTQTHYMAGLKYFSKPSDFVNSSLHLGIRVDLPLNPSLKLNLDKVIKTQIMTIGFLQELILYRQEGFSEVSQVSFNRQLTTRLSAAFVNSLVWSDATNKFVLRNNVVLSQDLANERTLTLSIGANAQFSPRTYYDSYDTSLSYRQLVFSNWLYGTTAVGANFAKSDNFNNEKFVQLRLDIYFKKY
jgi:hypothetical protein